MSIKEMQTKSSQITQLINDADAILIGAGAGLSAAGSLNYNDQSVFEKYYPQFKSKYKTIFEGIVDNWSINKDNEKKYWAFWSTHIYNIAYVINGLPIYNDLLSFLGNKNYFVITTNADRQFFKAGFDKNKIFDLQGSYNLLQCKNGCDNYTVENHDIVKSLKNSITSKLEVSGGLIPKCPLCGDYLVPCLRVDSNFVEEPFMKNKQAYLDFVNFHLDKKLVLLELGVGFNTPVIIKYPFEDLANTFSNISLVRVNIDHTKPRSNRNSNIIELKQDLNLFVKELE